MNANLKMYDVGTTFNLPAANGAQIAGLEPTNDPMIAKVDPAYVFRLDLLRVLAGWWSAVRAGATKDGLWLAGPTGSGKTSLPEQFLARLNVPYYSITVDKYTEVAPLIQSKTLANGTLMPQDGVIVQAFRDGCPLVINEIDRMNAATMSGLHDIVERQVVTIPDTGEVIVAEPGFCLICTANTRGLGDASGLHRGAEQMDIAFMDRFLALHVGYMDEQDEVDLVVARNPQISPVVASKLVKVANEIRTAFDAVDGNGINVTMSTRTLNRWAMCMTIFATVRNQGTNVALYALDLALGNKTDDGTRDALHQIVQRVAPELVQP